MITNINNKEGTTEEDDINNQLLPPRKDFASPVLSSYKPIEVVDDAIL